MLALVNTVREEEAEEFYSEQEHYNMHVAFGLRMENFFVKE